MVAQLIVHPHTGPLTGSVPLPADEQILLPRLALGVLSRGRSTYLGAAGGRAVRIFLEALARFGVVSEIEGDRVVVQGTGIAGLSESSEALDLRGEAQAAALLIGLVAARPFETELYVDDVVLDTLGPVLTSLGLAESGSEPGARRLLLRGTGARPEGLELVTSGLFPWVKQALLLLGLRASGPTLIEEQLASADHLERALLRVRAPFEVVGSQILLHPPRDEDALAPSTWEAVGSMDLVAYLGAAACLVPGSRVEARGVGTNPTRSGFLTLARLLGGQTGFSPQGDAQGEPFGNIWFGGSKLRPADLAGEQMVRLGDGALPLSVLLGQAEGTSSLTDLVSSGRSSDARVFQRLGGYLMNAGVRVQPSDIGLALEGRRGQRFRALEVTTGGDPRLGLLGSVLGLFADGPSVIDDVDCLRDIFPRWVGTLRALGATIEVRTT